MWLFYEVFGYLKINSSFFYYLYAIVCFLKIMMFVNKNNYLQIFLYKYIYLNILQDWIYCLAQSNCINDISINL